MKKSLLFLLAILFAASFVKGQITYDGNLNEPVWQLISSQSGGPSPSFGAGHEVNALYALSSPTQLFMAIAGNVQFNNRIIVFIDSKTGGYNTANFGRLNAPLGPRNFNSGTTFDPGFEPDYCLAIGTDGSANYFFDLYTLSGNVNNSGSGGPNDYLGDSGAGTNGSNESRLGANPANSDNGRGFELGLDLATLGYDPAFGNIRLMVMYISDGGFLSNQFLSPANSSDGNYAGNAVSFGAAAPNPVTVSISNASTLPVTFSKFQASMLQGSVQLRWEAAETDNLSHYVAERSANGRQFALVGRAEPRTGSLTAVYNLTDERPLAGANFYRIVAVGKNGDRRYSQVLRVMAEAPGVGFSVWPHAGGGQMALRLSQLPAGQYNLQVLNSGGQLLYSRNITNDGGEQNLSIPVPLKAGSGIHYVVLRGEGAVYRQTTMW